MPVESGGVPKKKNYEEKKKVQKNELISLP